MPDVATLLRDSMAAHNEAKQRRRQKQPDIVAITEAWMHRTMAHQADPEHADPAWQAEQHQTPSNSDTHEALMAFYRQRLGL